MDHVGYSSHSRMYFQAPVTVNTPPVAFFDFDGTLTRGDTLLPFLKFLVGAPQFYMKMLLLSPVLAAYVCKILQNNLAKDITLKAFLAGYHIEVLQQYGRQFAYTLLPANLCPTGMERFEWHKSQGHDCVLVSASLDVYLAPWSQMLNFKDHITSEISVESEGFVSGALVDGNCYGEEKLRRINSWLGERNPETTYAYGDTEGDRPMLLSVNHGMMMNRNKTAFIEIT
jgi:phosphatidylglycerophosphatase C